MTETEVIGPFDLGLGFQGYVAVSTLTGKTYVAEATTGAIVGPSLEQVKADIKDCGDKKVVQQQVDEAATLKKRARRIPAAMFWEKMAKTKPGD